jgi:IclR helix-turn-helix domain
MQPAMANPIEQTAKAIRARLAELVGEQQQLQKALAALEGLLRSERGKAAQAPTDKTDRRRPAPRVSASARRRSTAPRRRRGPSRADQFLELVAERPGITVAEAAERLDASRQTLYNLTARLQREGRLRKDGRGFYPAEQPPPALPHEGPASPPASA